ncbi:MAG: hypothetical protein D3916_02225 [Candidatus Electrothrix sp. MAN1_4]|nr:hypothetical protein [Candidatus Electrothrix sp. MAN1_4]
MKQGGEIMERSFFNQERFFFRMEASFLKQEPAFLKDVIDYIVSSRSLVKGVFGSDSSEYDMVGGTRASERKKGRRHEDEEE